LPIPLILNQKRLRRILKSRTLAKDHGQNHGAHRTSLKSQKNLVVTAASKLLLTSGFYPNPIRSKFRHLTRQRLLLILRLKHITWTKLQDVLIRGSSDANAKRLNNFTRMRRKKIKNELIRESLDGKKVKLRGRLYLKVSARFKTDTPITNVE